MKIKLKIIGVIFITKTMKKVFFVNFIRETEEKSF